MELLQTGALVSARYARLNIVTPERGTGGAARIYEFENYA